MRNAPQCGAFSSGLQPQELARRYLRGLPVKTAKSVALTRKPSPGPMELHLPPLRSVWGWFLTGATAKNLSTGCHHPADDPTVPH
jgi:hypothetical protein